MTDDHGTINRYKNQNLPVFNPLAYVAEWRRYESRNRQAHSYYVQTRAAKAGPGYGREMYEDLQRRMRRRRAAS